MAVMFLVQSQSPLKLNLFLKLVPRYQLNLNKSNNFFSQRLHPEEEISNFLTAFLKGALQNINLRIEPYNLNCLQLEYKNEKTMSSKFSPGTTELYKYTFYLCLLM